MSRKLMFLIILAISLATLSGTIQADQALYERWDGSGDVDLLLTDTTTPDYTEMLSSLEYEALLGDYRARITAMIVPPVTGDYTFWLVSDDNGRLWISTDHDPANAYEIARESSWSGGWDNWNDGTESQSEPISLVGGEKYWLRAAHQQGGGEDWIRVGWGSTDAGIADHTVITEQYIVGDSSVSNPTPANGETVIPPAAGAFSLSWEIEDPCTVDVYWNNGNSDVNTINFQYHIDQATGQVVQIANDITAKSVTSLTIVEEKNYYWQVDVVDPCSIDSRVWNFTTLNAAPDVDAGLKQAKWLPDGGGSVIFQLAPTVSDDILPEGGVMASTWSGSGISFGDPCALVTTATITSAGTYTATLTVNDDGTSGKEGSDTVTLKVYANDFTGLLGRYDMEEANGATKINDDYADLLVANRPKGTRMNDIVTAGTDGTTLGVADSGHNDTGTGNMSPAPVYDGVAQGLVFDGSAGHINMIASDSDPNLESWYPYANDPDSDPYWTASWADLRDGVTVMAWLKVDTSTGWDNNWESIISKGWDNARGDGAYALWRNDAGDGLMMSAYGVTPNSAGGTVPVNDGDWHLVAGTYDGAHLCVYVDGLVDTCVETDGAQINLSDAPLCIGETYDPSTLATYAPFGGTMDEVRIYSIGLPWASDAAEGTLNDNTARSIVSIYRETDGHANCGGNYLPGDANEDCFVNIADVKTMAEIWLDCNDIANGDCD